MARKNVFLDCRLFGGAVGDDGGPVERKGALLSGLTILTGAVRPLAGGMKRRGRGAPDGTRA